MPAPTLSAAGHRARAGGRVTGGAPLRRRRAPRALVLQVLAVESVRAKQTRLPALGRAPSARVLLVQTGTPDGCLLLIATSTCPGFGRARREIAVKKKQQPMRGPFDPGCFVPSPLQIKPEERRPVETPRSSPSSACWFSVPTICHHRASVSVTPPTPIWFAFFGAGRLPWCIRTPPRPVRAAREDGGGEANRGGHRLLFDSIKSIEYWPLILFVRSPVDPM
jgi:hypothetical protein